MLPSATPSPNSQPYLGLALEAIDNLLSLKSYSYNTHNNYSNRFILFLQSFPERKPSGISTVEVMQFLLGFRQSPKWSAFSQNQLISAIKFFYEQVLKRPKEVYDLPRAQKPQQAPSVFSVVEIKALLDACENLKHKTILCLAYASGLRVSEIVQLKIKDMGSKRP